MTTVCTPLTCDTTAYTADNAVLTADMTEICVAASTTQPPGGAGKRYNVGNLDLETWQKKHKKLKARIERVQEEIQAKRDQIVRTADYKRIEVLKQRLASLQELLLKLLGQLDEARKMQDLAEEGEVLAIYMAYRTLH